MLPEAEPRRKSRMGLFAPFVLLLLVVAGWSGGWFWLKGQAEQRIDAAAAQVKTAGGELTWKTRTISGYPFRLDVAMTGVTAKEPSGWAVKIPTLNGEAFAYALNHWVLEAPQGVTFTRPETASPGSPNALQVVTQAMAAGFNSAAAFYTPKGGDVTVSGEVLRASVVIDTTGKEPFPRVTVEGTKLRFATPANSAPFWMDAVEHLEFHLRPGPNDQGGLLLRLDGAKARLTGLVARIAQDKPVLVVWDSIFTKASMLKGRDWPTALRSWSTAGGQLSVGTDTQIVGGDAVLGVKQGLLGVADDGHITGSLDVELKQAPRALMAMGEAGTVAPEVATAAAVTAATQQDASQTMQAKIVFENGVSKLGPLPLTEAPRLW